MIFISQKMNKEQQLNNFILSKKFQGIPDNFMPFSNTRMEYVNNSKKYYGYPSFRNNEEKEIRLKTFEECRRFFERVRSCIIKIDDDMEFDEEWNSKMLKMAESSYAFEQKYWLNSEWDQLWAHAFSEDGHLPTPW